ncbi:hypothetical protein [Natronomonas sp. EA1]|uniref:hypothetical protein n=1 Tax=Natronomonas sp. EA1 TaxID=3421655 RepID=UPI003EB9BEC2
MAFTDLFADAPAIKGVSVDPANGFGEYLVRYEGEDYWATVLFFACPLAASVAVTRSYRFFECYACDT